MEILEFEAPCFDLEVENDHSYLVNNNLIAHNTEVCRGLDGKIFKLGDPDLDRLSPPNHFNCRSVLVPITIGTQVDEDEFITPSQAGRAIEDAGDGFA